MPSVIAVSSASRQRPEIALYIAPGRRSPVSAHQGATRETKDGNSNDTSAHGPTLQSKIQLAQKFPAKIPKPEHRKPNEASAHPKDTKHLDSVISRTSRTTCNLAASVSSKNQVDTSKKEILDKRNSKRRTSNAKRSSCRMNSSPKNPLLDPGRVNSSGDKCKIGAGSTHVWNEIQITNSVLFLAVSMIIY
ncbi:hypothetical protein HK096_005918 [Nowakowskiella sp. JEL0078]|nr:hypothetical protein HK096_005918 [Nowakowskiella sp. JEL0078]